MKMSLAHKAETSRELVYVMKHPEIRAKGSGYWGKFLKLAWFYETYEELPEPYRSDFLKVLPEARAEQKRRQAGE